MGLESPASGKDDQEMPTARAADGHPRRAVFRQARASAGADAGADRLTAMVIVTISSQMKHR